jgi:hypothetical protein
MMMVLLLLAVVVVVATVVAAAADLLDNAMTEDVVTWLLNLVFFF